MKQIINLTLITFLTAVLISCGGPSELEEKKAKLDEYKKQLAETKANIKKLESEIAKLDEDFKADKSGNVLVSTQSLERKPFVHKVEVRGSVESRKNVMISAETMGRIENIHVTEGEEVARGQLLLKLDADILENNVAEVQTQLELAEAVYKRQENLWEQNIGTEIQYLQAKNNKESLERRLKTLKSQLDQAYVRAPFSGVVDHVPVKVGEMAQPGLPLIRIVNQNEMYLMADVSEAYLGKFQKGDTVGIYFPSQDARMKSRISSVGKVINQENRTFKVEVAIPPVPDEFRPNQVAIITLTDYENQNAISVPTKLVQSDDKGKYIYTVEEKEEKKVAKKIRVETGKTYDGKTEIVSGLKGNERIINQGYRDVTEGVEVSLATASL